MYLAVFLQWIYRKKPLADEKNGGERKSDVSSFELFDPGDEIFEFCIGDFNLAFN